MASDCSSPPIPSRVERELGVSDLKEMFHAEDTEWHLYKRKNGTVGIQAPTKAGLHNVEQAVEKGAARLGTARGVSRRGAIKAAKKKRA